MMVSFIDAHRGRYGVGPLCAQVPIAPSTYSAHKAREAEPERVSARARRDGWLSGEIRRVYDEHFQVYGVRKVWRQLRGEGVTVARCTVARLMRRMGLQACPGRGEAGGAVRGRRVKTTRAVVHGERPADRVNREFQVSRPNALWVSDPRFHHSGAGSDPRFHGGRLYVATWRGFAYTAFVIDAYARRIVGWRVSSSLHTDLALDALEQALHERRAPRDGLIHHSDRGVQYLSLRYTERLAHRGIAPSVGSVGDSYDNALAESIIGLYKTELIRHSRESGNQRGPWRHCEAVELATLQWVHWYNHRRLFGPLGHVPPAAFEAHYYHQLRESAMAA